jgi:DNA polymerase (family X)
MKSFNLSTKQLLARRLWTLADLTQANDSRRSFSSQAFRNAVWALDDLPSDLDVSRERLLGVPGIGTAIADLIAEFRDTGDLGMVARLEEVLPRDAPALARLPRMAPKRLRWLKEQVGVDTVPDLLAAIEQGALGGLVGVGEATLALWRDRLGLIGGLPILRARGIAARFEGHLTRHFPDIAVHVVGAVRRFDERVDVLELLIDVRPGLEDFLAGSALVTAIQPAEGSFVLDSLVGRVIVYVSAPSSMGSELVLRTGPPEHVEALRRAGAAAGALSWWEAGTEDEFYARVGSSVIPPPARAGDFPMEVPLVLAGHLRGDFHLHSDWSPDGRQTLAQLVAGARRMGWEYLAVTDHAHGLRFGGLDEEALLRQDAVLTELEAANPDLLILRGAELNIDRDGNLDYSDAVLQTLDLRLAALHSHFGLPESDQTERLLRVVSHPLVHAIAHPTGRRIGVRPPVALDLAAIYEAASAHGTALEVNGHLDRLDLSAVNARAAAEAGVLFLANSDAHRVGELMNTSDAVRVLQRARVDPSQVVNTWEKGKLIGWLNGEPASPNF